MNAENLSGFINVFKRASASVFLNTCTVYVHDSMRLYSFVKVTLFALFSL
mgnify:FL=1